LKKTKKKSHQIFYHQRSGATPNPGSRSPLRLINLSANLTYISQLSQGTMGSKETSVERHLRLKAELFQLEQDAVIEEDDFFVPVTAPTPTVPTPTMALMDVAVAQDRAAVSLNNENPVFTAHSTGATLSYPNPPEENADVDDEGEIDLYVSLDLDVDVDAALDANDGGRHDEKVAFEDDVGNDDSSDDDADDADPLHPFQSGTFSGNDAAVETLRLYVDVRKDPKRRIIS
jgi:hypothetical protein